jgi:hypothetical protein
MCLLDIFVTPVIMAFARDWRNSSPGELQLTLAVENGIFGFSPDVLVTDFARLQREVCDKETTGYCGRD